MSISEDPSTVVLVFISGDEVVKYPICELRSTNGGLGTPGLLKS